MEVVVTDRRLVHELLDKSSAISIYRPPSYVGNLVTEGDHELIMNAGTKWKAMRKLIVQGFTENICDKKHLNVVNAKAVQMLRDAFIDPKDLTKHPKRFANSIIMNLVTSPISRPRR